MSLRRALCLLACTVVLEEPVRVIQETPQRVEARHSYEWCLDLALDGKPTGLYLVERSYWVVDGHSLRSAGQDTPASQSRILWGRSRAESGVESEGPVAVP